MQTVVIHHHILFNVCKQFLYYLVHRFLGNDSFQRPVDVDQAAGLIIFLHPHQNDLSQGTDNKQARTDEDFCRGG